MTILFSGHSLPDFYENMGGTSDMMQPTQPVKPLEKFRNRKKTAPTDRICPVLPQFQTTQKYIGSSMKIKANNLTETACFPTPFV